MGFGWLGCSGGAAGVTTRARERFPSGSFADHAVESVVEAFIGVAVRSSSRNSTSLAFALTATENQCSHCGGGLQPSFRNLKIALVALRNKSQRSKYLMLNIRLLGSILNRPLMIRPKALTDLSLAPLQASIYRDCRSLMTLSLRPSPYQCLDFGSFSRHGEIVSNRARHLPTGGGELGTEFRQLQVRNELPRPRSDCWRLGTAGQREIQIDSLSVSSSSRTRESVSWPRSVVFPGWSAR